MPFKYQSIDTISLYNTHGFYLFFDFENIIFVQFCFIFFNHKNKYFKWTQKGIIFEFLMLGFEFLFIKIS